MTSRYYYFQHNLFTRAKHKTFTTSTDKTKYENIFYVQSHFVRSGQRYPSKVFCLLIYGKILIPQKTKFSVQCINFAANGLFTHCNQWFLTVAKILLKKLTEIIYGACTVPSYVLLILPSWYIFWGVHPLEKKKYSSSTKMNLLFSSIQ